MGKSYMGGVFSAGATRDRSALWGTNNGTAGTKRRRFNSKIQQGEDNDEGNKAVDSDKTKNQK